jgi:hypothetical protein
MPRAAIFTNQTTDLIFNLVNSSNSFIVVGGIAQVDIAGVLDGANMTMEYLFSQDEINPPTIDQWIPIIDSQWLAAADPAPVLPDGSIIQLDNRAVRFVLSGAGGSTDISVSFTYNT